MSSKKPETNIYDVFIRFLDLSYDLIKSGNIIGVIFLIFANVIAILSWKLPPEHISPILFKVFSFFESERYYLFPMTFVLALSLAGNIYQRIVYKREINRLVEYRSAFMHGTSKKGMKKIKHMSSKFELTTE